MNGGNPGMGFQEPGDGHGVFIVFVDAQLQGLQAAKGEKCGHGIHDPPEDFSQAPDAVRAGRVTADETGRDVVMAAQIFGAAVDYRRRPPILQGAG